MLTLPLHTARVRLGHTLERVSLAFSFLIEKEGLPAAGADDLALTLVIARDVHDDASAPIDEVLWAERFLIQEYDLCVLTN